MQVLVTGCAGYFGSNLCEYFLQKDYEVVGIDNFNDYYNPKFKEYNIIDFKDHLKFKLYRGDILDDTLMDEIFSNHKFDGVVHLAAWAGVTKSIEIPKVYVRNNVEGTVNVAEMCIKHGVSNIIFASTSAIYGDNPTPFKEDMRTDAQLSPYPATKKGCEVLLKTFSLNNDLNVTIFRIFNPLGPRLRPDILLPKLVRACLYDYKCPIYWNEKDLHTTGRDYTYILHMQDAVDYALKHPFKYEIFNLGNSNPIMLDDIIKTVEKVVGIAPKIEFKEHRQGEMLVTYADISKAKEMLSYDPSTSIEESVKIYYEWFQKQEDWYKKGEF